ncbi:hypothetical protein ABZ214_05060 [Streptomyces iakyrus]|uniref:hypothetical protein n=1 Tax=Streptomyces iakyrus TaxID=68219 RepID=UPI0033A89222
MSTEPTAPTEPAVSSPAPTRRTFIATTTTAVGGAVLAGGLVTGSSVFGAEPATPPRRQPAAAFPFPRPDRLGVPRRLQKPNTEHHVSGVPQHTVLGPHAPTPAESSSAAGLRPVSAEDERLTLANAYTIEHRHRTPGIRAALHTGSARRTQIRDHSNPTQR